MAEVLSGVTVPELPLLTTGMATDLILMTRAGVGKKMLYSDFCEHVVAVHETAVANGNKTIVDAINEVYSSIGGPKVVRLAARMTDTSKIYVYVGNETDYLTNHWYYWDGSSWANGGVYNATAVQTDTTLSISGTAADGKATGDAISAVASDLSEVQDTINALSAAVSGDAGKMLIAKTVTNGKVTAWEYKAPDVLLTESGVAADAKAIGSQFAVTKQMAPRLIWQYPVSRVFGIPSSGSYLPQAICYDPTRSRWAAVARRSNTTQTGKLLIASTLDGLLNPDISVDISAGHCNDIKYDADNDRFVVCVLGEAGTDAGKTINFYSAATGEYLGNHVFSGNIVVATLDYYGDYVYTYGNQDSDYVYRHNKDFTGTTQLFQLNKTDFRIGIGFDDNEEFMRNTMFIKDGNFYFGICTREILPEATRAILGTMPEAARYGGGFYITDITGRQVATYLFDYERYEEWQCACVVGKWLYSLTDSGYMSIYKTNFYFPELCRKPSAELVQAETDLNDYFRPGEYICQNSNIERDLLNLPRKHTSGFTLYVIHNMQFGRLQVIVYNNTQASSSNYIYKIYIRKFTLTSRNAAGSWAEWKRIPIEDIPV